MTKIESSIQVICLESEAFYALVRTVVDRLKDEQETGDPWIDDKEAMRMLRISSKTTLQKLRDEGAIRYTQPKKKIILYFRDSILEYLENHAKETF